MPKNASFIQETFAKCLIVWLMSVSSSIYHGVQHWRGNRTRQNRNHICRAVLYYRCMLQGYVRLESHIKFLVQFLMQLFKLNTGEAAKENRCMIIPFKSTPWFGKTNYMYDSSPNFVISTLCHFVHLQHIMLLLAVCASEL